MAESITGDLFPPCQYVTSEAIPDGDRQIILGLVEDSADSNSMVSSYEALYGLREKVVQVILDAYATGQYHKSTPYHPLDVLSVCLSESSVSLAGSFLAQYPDVLPSPGYEAIGRIAGVGIIPYVEVAVGPLPDDNLVDNATRVRVSRALKLAYRAQANAQSVDDKQAWRTVIGRWLNLRDDYDGSLLFTEGSRSTDVPDQWALETARFLIGFKTQNVGFVSSTRRADHIPARAQEERTMALGNLWVRIGESLEPADPRHKIGERVLRTAHREEHDSSPLAVPIGIEVEIEEASLIRDALAVDTPDARFERMCRLLRGFRRVEQDGIPAGNDEEWEYAHLPARHYRTLIREVQALSRLGLLDLEYPNPLHVTLGDITSIGSGGEETFVLAQSMLATGWSTTGDRIRQPLNKDHDSWAHLSKGGVYEREAADIMGASNTAVEFRVHIAEGLGELACTLRSYHQLGAALRAFQARTGGLELDANQMELAGIWRDFSKDAGQLFTNCQLADPRLGPWHAEGLDGMSGKTKGLDKNYLILADMLDYAHAYPTGRAAQVRGAFRQTFINHGAKVRGILNRTRAL